jgi:hypothetical protein
MRKMILLGGVLASATVLLADSSVQTAQCEARSLGSNDEHDDQRVESATDEDL